MPRSRWTPCPDPTCPELIDRDTGDCPQGHAAAQRKAHQQRTDAQRPAARHRGYDTAWRRRRADYLRRHPHCCDCGAPATDADHDPHTRAELATMGVTDPDADRWLRPRCHPCHSAKTARNDGGYGNPKRTTA